MKGNREQKLKDCMLLLKMAYEIYHDYEDDEDVQFQIVKIYNNFHRKWKKGKYNITEITMISKYLESINTYERTQIIALGKKVAKIK
jgi:hypothetical protein